METSVEAAEVLVPPQPDETPSPDPETSESETAGAALAAASSPDALDPMEEFSQRLEDIIHTHGSTSGLLNKQDAVLAEVEKVNNEAKDDVTGSVETELSLIMQSVDELSSPEEKLGALVRKYAELVALRHRDALKSDALQQKLSAVLEERQQLQAEHHSSIAARSKLETLCREQQSFYNLLREETLQRCKEDEEKRTEITTHFQSMLTEIQSQIELHSARNEKLCRENINLTDKLENLMTQCERREESLEKINNHRDLQQKLIEAKLQQANALLAEAEEKHKREKEYLLREAIDKTKKCFAMKEQELAMKKKLTLYGQKFDEFQATLAKSNEIYVRFKKEMENMSDKMKKVEKESSLWKTRFENCNKALTDMIEERTEKGKEYDLFVLKIQKLEKLCRALQEERKVLYDKIKEVRHSNASLPTKVFGSSNLSDNPEGAETSALITTDELREMEEEDHVLTDGMVRLKEEQAKLQEFAASLLVTTTNNQEEENNELDLDEDLVSSAFFHFKTKPQIQDVLDSVPVQVNNLKSKEPDSELPQPGKVDEVQDRVMVTAEVPATQETTLETSSSDPDAEVQTQVETEEVQQVKPDAEIQQPGAPEPEREQVKFEITPEAPVKDEKDQQQFIEPTPAAEPENVKAEPQTDPVKAETLEESGEGKPLVPLQVNNQPHPDESVPTAETEETEDAEESKVETLKESGEVKPAVSVEEKAQKETAEAVHAPEAASETSESAASPSNPPEAAADSSKKQLPKKKKKKSSKS